MKEQVLFREVMQNGIEDILKKHEIIPVVTVHAEQEIDQIFESLRSRGINCIEITLRTDFSWEAISIFKERYGDVMDVGVGTIIKVSDLQNCKDYEVDFMVSPGWTNALLQHMRDSGIPFLPGVATPSEIIKGIEMELNCFKFFPANIYGGVDALNTFNQVFKGVKFCPTGGINKENYHDYLSLDNVLSVGGSWVTK